MYFTKMKKLLLLLASFVFIWNVFASYTLTLSQIKKINEVAQIIFQKVETKYHTKQKQQEIYWTIVNTLDLYILTHKLTDKQKASLLCLKTLILGHMGYKVGNPIKVKVVDDINS